MISDSAKKMRVRVDMTGVSVVKPAARADLDVIAFLRKNEKWLLLQLERLDRLRNVRRPSAIARSEILFRGRPTIVKVEEIRARLGPNRVELRDGELIIRTGFDPQTPPMRSLENFLRRAARIAISQKLKKVAEKLKRRPNTVYVMGQRTKWGNCSSRGNLSFNWRTIMAPDFVLEYLVTHEAVHLMVPDHSKRFWITVQSICPATSRARGWLSAHQNDLMIDLNKIC
jgi:predicted metal-dependent hydrolase